VRWFDIPKSDGKTRTLGIPTVADRIALMMVKRHLEPIVEPEFHPDSYGYRAGKSALYAVGVAESAGRRIEKNHIPGPLGVRARNSDSRLIREKLNLEPRASLRDGQEVIYGSIEGRIRAKD
jgi:hypothetical protein